MPSTNLSLVKVIENAGRLLGGIAHHGKLNLAVAQKEVLAANFFAHSQRRLAPRDVAIFNVPKNAQWARGVRRVPVRHSVQRGEFLPT